MKTNKLLKVLSAATIISTIAVVENTTQSNTTFAIENNAVGAKDIKNLPDGEYKITAEAINFDNGKNPSMAASGLDNSKTKLIVKNGQYFVNVSFNPIDKAGFKGYLGNLKYYDGPKTHKNRSEIDDSEFKDTTITESYSEKETDAYVKVYKKKFPNRTAYPKTLSYRVDKNKIDSTYMLETYTQVFVPVMESITAGSGTQNMILKFDLSKVEVNQPTNVSPQPKPIDSTGTTSNSNTSNNSESTTPKPTETPRPNTSNNVKPSNKPQGSEGTTPSEANPRVTTSTPKPTPSATATFYKGVKATLLHAYQPGRKSMGDAALEHSNVTVFKEGSTYHYIVRFHNISVGTLNDGITGFWVNGTEYPVKRTGGANNQVEVHFTSSEKLSSVPVSVFVPTMEKLMTGGGKQNATLSFDWSNVTEQQGQPIAGGQPGVSATGNGAGALTPKGGRLNNGRLSNTGLETSSSILAGALTLMSAFMVGRRKQQK